MSSDNIESLARQAKIAFEQNQFAKAESIYWKLVSIIQTEDVPSVVIADTLQGLSMACAAQGKLKETPVLTKSLRLRLRKNKPSSHS